MNTYLFDFDGTLVDSMPTFIAAILRILDENQVSYPADVVKIVTPLGFEGTAEYFNTLGVDVPRDELVARMKEYMLDGYFHHIQAKENVISSLETLKARGCSLNVLTASPHITLDACLKRLGMFDLFDNVWSCEDFHTSKADPHIYEMAAEKLGKRVGEVTFLDDNFGACSTAKKAGMRVVGVYDESSADAAEQIAGITDGYIRDFSQLL